jgi:hypothetical protein
MANAPTISVDIVAAFGAFKEQLDQASKATKDFADRVKTSLREVTAPFEKLQSLIIGVAAVAAGGAVFKDVVDSTLETTGAVVNLQRAFGGNLETSNQLASQLRLLGISTDEYTGMALRLDRQIRANNESLQKMGFTARDLDLGQKGLMDKAIAKLLEYKEGVDRNIAAQVLFGRNVQDIFPLLRTALEGLPEHARQLEEALQLTVTETDKQRAREYKLAMNELGMAFEGIKKAIGDAVLPYLTRFAQWFTAQAPTIIGGMKETMKAVIEWAFDAADGLVRFSAEVIQTLNALLATAALVGNFLGVVSDKGAYDFVARLADINDGILKLKERALAGVAEIRAAVTAGGPASAEPEPAIAGSLPKGFRSADDLLKTDKSAVAAQVSQYQTAIRLQDTYFRQEEEKLNADAKMGRITEDEKTEALLAALQRRHDAQLAAIEGEINIHGLSKAQYQKVLDEELQLEAKFEAERQKIRDQGLLHDQQSWQSALGSLQSAWDSQLRGLLSRTTTFAQAMKNIAADLVLKMIEEFEKLAIIKPLSNALASTLGDAASIIPGILKMITSSLGAVFAGTSANLAPALGPAAPAAAAAVTAGVEATALGISKLDVGTDYVLKSGVAYIHEGESVIPAAQTSGPYTGAGNGGFGGTINLNLSAFNPSGLQQLIRQMVPQMARELASYQTLNPSTR